MKQIKTNNNDSDSDRSNLSSAKSELSTNAFINDEETQTSFEYSFINDDETQTSFEYLKSNTKSFLRIF